MLASIFSKVTTSLGKNYVFAGLLPSAAFLIYFAWYFKAAPFSLDTVQLLLTDSNSWKPLAVDAATWIAIGFLFYWARPLVFSFFQRVPASWIDRRRVFRRVRQRTSAQRALEETELRGTALRWLTALDLDRAKTREIPHWIVWPQPPQALEKSQRGRETLVAVDRTVGAVLGLTVSACDAIADGIFGVLGLTVSACDAIADGIFVLYLIAARRQKPEIDTAVEAEIGKWRFAAGSEPAKDILACVEQELKRKHTRAYLKREKYGEGAYIFPTELGNRISALDDYAQDRYGIDTATIWDRIWWVLPKEMKGEVGDARLALETLINVSLALFLGGLVLSGVEIANCKESFALTGPSCNAPRLIIFVAAALATSMLVYQAAVFAMEILTVKTTTLVDMYRLPMLEQLGFQPETVAEEKALYTELKGFFTQASELSLTRKLKAAGKPEHQDETASEAGTADAEKPAEADDPDG